MIEIVEKLKLFSISYPDRVAYTINGDSITYSELWKKASFYGDLLQRQGSGSVTLIGHKEIDFFVAVISCLIAERAYIPIDISLPDERIKKIVSVTETDLIISFNDRIKVGGKTSLFLGELESFGDADIKASCNNTAYIIFTSGSTGEPKGVPISYDNLQNFTRWISGLAPLKSYNNITVLNQALFSFDLSVADIYYSLFNGHTLAALDKQDICSFDTVFKTIREKKPDLMVITPTFAKICLTDKSFCSESFPFLKCIYFCGEILEPSTVRKLFLRFPDLQIINAYGPTEATSAVSAVLITEEMANSLTNLPVGEMDNLATEIEIADGEIVLKGKSVFHGYIGGIEGGHFIENGIDCYRTGDNGKAENNLLYCLGRCDRQIKMNGYRIELDEIESCISSIDGVTACAVVPSHASSGKIKNIGAYVSGNNIDERLIRDELKKSLPSYMIPKTISIVDRLTVNENGKTDRKALVKND